MSDTNDVKSLIEKHNRYLQLLKEQQAIFGLHTPPHILMAIADTEEQIKLLQTELEQLSKKEGRTVLSSFEPSKAIDESKPLEQLVSKETRLTISTEETVVEVRIQGNVSAFTPKQRDNLLIKLAIILEFPPESIYFLSQRPGSIILRLKMPTKAANQLAALIKASDPRLQALGIQQANVISSEIYTSKKVESKIADKTYPSKSSEGIPRQSHEGVLGKEGYDDLVIYLSNHGLSSSQIEQIMTEIKRLSSQGLSSSQIEQIIMQMFKKRFGEE